jgi:hypothetical protein
VTGVAELGAFIAAGYVKVRGLTNYAEAAEKEAAAGRIAYEFMTDVAIRLRHRVQLSTDGHSAYLSAVEDAFGADVDHATLTKILRR